MLDLGGKRPGGETDWRERTFLASGALIGCQKSPLDEPEMKFSLFILKPPKTFFKGLFDIFGPQLNTILSVGKSLKYLIQECPAYRDKLCSTSSFTRTPHCSTQNFIYVEYQ